MKVTVCELRNDLDELEQDWQSLIAHVQSEDSELVLLPEMPFYPWPAKTRQVDPGAWEASVKAHDQWMLRLDELSPATVVGSRPVIRQGKRLNEGFIWHVDTGYSAVHTKYYLPDEEGFWEASWYDRGECEFSVGQSNKVRIGFLICTDLWFNFHAREYAKQGIHLLVCPRATPAASVEKWIAGGDVAAAVGVKAGVHAHAHKFRHTGATMFLRIGGNVFALKEILGHSTMEMVQRYVHLAQIDIEEAQRQASPVYIGT